MQVVPCDVPGWFVKRETLLVTGLFRRACYGGATRRLADVGRLATRSRRLRPVSGRRTALRLGGAAAALAGAVAGVAARAGRDGDRGPKKGTPPSSPEEAKRIRSDRLAEMNALGYDELSRYCDFKLACEVLGADGVKYAHETYTFYDNGPGSAIRVLVEVWAFDLSSFAWTEKLAGGGLWVPPGGEPADQWVDEDS